jgi:NitT/TauT family transport system permease protein
MIKGLLDVRTPYRFRYGVWVIWGILLALLWYVAPVTALPSIRGLVESFVTLSKIEGSGNFFYNIYVTLKLQLISLGIASILSLTISYLGRLPAFQPLNKIVEVLRYIPIVGFTLIFYSLFSIGFEMKVAMLTTGLTFFLVTSMNEILDSIPRMKYELAEVLNLSNWQTFKVVVFFPTLPLILVVIMQNAAMSWLMITAVETFNATEGGMGRMIQIYSSSNQTEHTYLYLIMIGVIACIQDGIFRAAKYFFPHTFINERG